MKDTRIGESLWQIWEGEDYPEDSRHIEVIYYTDEHVDLDNDIVKKALASSIQRDGLSFSLGHSYRLIEQSKYVHAGYFLLEGERFPTFCEADDSRVDNVVPATYVEVIYAD